MACTSADLCTLACCCTGSPVHRLWETGERRRGVKLGCRGPVAGISYPTCFRCQSQGLRRCPLASGSPGRAVLSYGVAWPVLDPPSKVRVGQPTFTVCCKIMGTLWARCARRRPAHGVQASCHLTSHVHGCHTVSRAALRGLGLCLQAAGVQAWPDGGVCRVRKTRERSKFRLNHQFDHLNVFCLT